MFKSKICVALAFIFTLISATISQMPSTNAFDVGIDVYSNRYNQYFECTINDRKSSGSVRIDMWPTSNKIKNYSVKMLDEKGRYIWEEDGALTWNGSRTFHLGNDHKVYRIYIKANGGSGNVALAVIKVSSNVTIKKRSW